MLIRPLSFDFDPKKISSLYVTTRLRVAWEYCLIEVLWSCARNIHNGRIFSKQACENFSAPSWNRAGPAHYRKNQIKSVWKWTKQCFCTDVIPLVLNIDNIVHVDFTSSTANHTVPMHILFYCMNMTSLKLQCVIRLRSAEDPSVVAIPCLSPVCQ